MIVKRVLPNPQSPDRKSPLTFRCQVSPPYTHNTLYFGYRANIDFLCWGENDGFIFVLLGHRSTDNQKAIQMHLT